MDDLYILKLVQKYKDAGQVEIADEILSMHIKIQGELEMLRDKIDENQLLIEDYREHLFKFQESSTNVIDELKGAFPDRDLRGHLHAHQKFITAAQIRQDRKEAVVKNVITGGSWATIIFLSKLVWDYVKEAK